MMMDTVELAVIEQKPGYFVTADTVGTQDRMKRCMPR
jgi:hypothetical protein